MNVSHIMPMMGNGLDLRSGSKMTKTMYIDLYCKEGQYWMDYIKENGITYTNATAFTMCGGIRLDGVSHFPDNIPSYIRAKQT